MVKKFLILTLLLVVALAAQAKDKETTNTPKYNVVRATPAGNITWDVNDSNTCINEVYLERVPNATQGDAYDGAAYMNVTGTNISFTMGYYFPTSYGVMIQHVAVTNNSGSASTYTIVSNGNLGSDGSTTFHYKSSVSGATHYSPWFSVSSDNGSPSTNGSDPVVSFLYGNYLPISLESIAMNFSNGSDGISWQASNIPIAAWETQRFIIIGGIGSINRSDTNTPDHAYAALQGLMNPANWGTDFTDFLTPSQKNQIVNWKVSSPTNVTGSTTSITQGASVSLTSVGGSGTTIWTSGSINGTVVGSGDVLTISPTSTNTYFARKYLDVGGYSVYAYSYTVSVLNPPAAPNSATADPASIVSGGSSNLSAISSEGQIRWFDAASGGTHLGTVASGATLNVSPTVTSTYYAETQRTGTATSLPLIMEKLHQNYASINSQIPNRVEYRMDATQYNSQNTNALNSNLINDGIYDMFDGGNYLSTDFSTNFYYSDTAITSNGVFGSGSSYFTKFFPGLFMLAADMNNVSWFRVSGNYGADGSGSYSSSSFTKTSGGITYYCYISRVYNAGDPSINQLIILPANGSISHYGISNTSDSYQQVSGLNSSSRLYYILYAGLSGAYIDDTNAGNIAQAFLDIVSSGTTGLSSASRSSVTVSVDQYPNTATVSAPENSSEDIDIAANLAWIAPTEGPTPTGYKLYFGSDNPPTNIENGTILGNTLSHNPADMLYNTTYFWRIIPLNGAVEAQNCPIWSFTTTDIYVDNSIEPVVPDPENPENTINPSVQITGVSGTYTPTIEAAWALDVGLPNPGLCLTMGAATFSGRTIRINPNLGFVPQNLVYRFLPLGAWVNISADPLWTANEVWFTIPAAKLDEDIIVVFPAADGETLAVTLSSFTAVLSTNFSSVILQWISQSETNHLGYNVYRSESNNLSQAMQINSQIINEGNSIGTQISYRYQDTEVYQEITYYYWLASVSINSQVEYFGPIAITIHTETDPIPDIPIVTKLQNAYPNPFNPSTNIRYSMAKPGTVTLAIYNLRGELIRKYAATHNTPGNFAFVWNGEDEKGKIQGSGTYLYKFQSGQYSETKKMVMLK